MEQQRPRNGLFYFVMMAALAVVFLLMMTRSNNAAVTTQREFLASVKEDKVASVSIKPNAQGATGEVVATMKDGTRRRFFVTDVNSIYQELEENKGVTLTVEDIPRENFFVRYILPILLVGGLMVIMFGVMNRQQAGVGAQMMNFGKNRARLADPKDQTIKFRDVAGLLEEKENLSQVVDFLRDPAKYTKLGARIPKGVLLVGPPGTGKTLLGKAVAGEAGVPFFSISGSDFVEMYVGVGASRVRDLFEEAKRNAPCIVFIDEIDAVARRRGAGLGGGHDEREQTLNQLLVEMDGFGVNEGIIMLAATNRVDILDPAILRPGRFDRTVSVGLPDVRGREEILRVHARNKPMGDDVDFKEAAKSTAGFSGADLENLLNEAAIDAAKEGRPYIAREDIRKAFVKVGIGTEKRSKVLSQKDREITAYHESGHAILFHLLPHVGPVYSVSIIPTGMGAAGYTMPLPEKDEVFNTRNQMLDTICVSLGGRIAEELVFEDVTTGASQDIKQATAVARAMVTRYGMSESLGLIAYDDDSGEVFLGRSFEKTRSFGEQTAAQIDEEIRKIVDGCYVRARRILEKHRDVLRASALLLLEKEKIDGKEFAALFGAESVEQ